MWYLRIQQICNMAHTVTNSYNLLTRAPVHVRNATCMYIYNYSSLLDPYVILVYTIFNILIMQQQICKVS